MKACGERLSNEGETQDTGAFPCGGSSRAARRLMVAREGPDEQHETPESFNN